MRNTTTAIAAYESPKARVIEFDIQSLVCTSLTGQSNESYEEGDTSDWFNN